MKSSIVAALVAVLLPACGQTPQVVETDAPSTQASVPYPSSAAYDAESGVLFVGSYADGSVQRFPVVRTAAGGALAPLPLDGREHVLRIRMDAARGRIWVLGSEAIQVYDGRTSRMLARIALGDMTQHSSEHCLPGMAIDGAGNVFVSSAIQPRLMRIDAVTYEASDHVLRTDAEKDKDFGISALAFAADGRTLYGASASIGALWQIDAVRATAQKLEVSHAVPGACALQVSARGDGSDPALYVAGGFRNHLARVDLSASSSLHRVAAMSAKGAVAVPTDFVSTPRELLVVNSRLSDHPDFDGYGTHAARFPIVAVRAP